MSKMVITESELNRLILESINEELEDEGWLSNFAGRAYEWGKNKFNNMRNDFNAGRNQYMQNQMARQGQQTGTEQGGPQDYPGLDGNQGEQPMGQQGTQPSEQPGAPQGAQQGAQPEVPQGQQGAQPAAPQRKPGARQNTATSFMNTLRAGQPAMVSQSVKNYLTAAIKAYSQAHPNAVSNNYFRTLANQIGKIRIGEYLNPQDVNIRNLQVLFNEFAKQQSWSVKENRIRKIVAESIRKILSEKNAKKTSVLDENRLNKIVAESVKSTINDFLLNEGPQYGVFDKMVKKVNDWRGTNGGKINAGLGNVYKSLANNDNYLSHVQKNAKKAAAMAFNGNRGWEYLMEDFNDKFGVVDSLRKTYANLPGLMQKIKDVYAKLFNQAYRDAWEELKRLHK